MEGRSKILVIGATGVLGKFMVAASAKAGHPTFAFIRQSTASNPDHEKAQIIHDFNNISGVTLLYGDLHDQKSLVDAIERVDVVISTLGHRDPHFKQIQHETNIIRAIKQVGTVKRFFPSEFGTDVDRVQAVEPLKTLLEAKVQVRRAIEKERIPHTFVSPGMFMGYFPLRLGQPNATVPPTDQILIMADGNIKTIFVNEEDIAAYTVKAVDDPRTLNKILYVRPPANIISINELVSLWEEKTGTTLKRIYVPEDQVLRDIQESSTPMNLFKAIAHVCFVKGELTNFDINPSIGVEACALYPDVNYLTIDQLLDQYISENYN